MNKESFKNPGKDCRPMRLRHEYGFKSDWSREEKNAKIEEVLNKVQTIGYSGVTTNTPFNEYLSDEGWKDLDVIIKKAIEKGMRLWIYDEKGYPSGKAGGRTLKDHPEYEAKGLVCIMKKFNFGDKVKISMPKYHDGPVAAYAYKLIEKTKPDCSSIYSKEEDLLADGMTGAFVDLKNSADKNGGIRWIAGEGFYNAKEGDKFVVCAYWQRKLYENTHACQNYSECRRYLSVINKDAVGEFINNTYEQYKKHAGKYFGKEIEAFFTDEPSLMSGYLDSTVHPSESAIRDEVHKDFPLYPVVTWEPFLFDEFRNRYGYGLYDNLHYLYAGTSKRAVKVRYDFNLMVTKLYEEAYYGQIEKFCHESGIKFSGHVLMEEYLLHHGIWEGNIFRIMSHMDIPGIDVLTTLPGDLVEMAVTPKLISSAATWFGKNNVMSEISAHEQYHFRKAPFGAREMRGAGAAQYVMGVDCFQSYFGEDALGEKEYKEYTDFLSRIGASLKGGRNAADIILYYPIEGVIAGTKGSDKFREVREYSKAELECENSWNSLAKSLMRNKLDYIMADTEAIESLCVVKDDDCPRLANMKTGDTYKVVVVPKMVATDEKFMDALAYFTENGITVIFDSLSVNLPSLSDTEDLKDDISELLSMENAINSNAEDIPYILKEKFIPQLEIPGDEAVIYTKREDTDMGLSEVYLMTNTTKDELSKDVLIDAGDFENVWNLDPDTGKISAVDFDFTDDGRIKIHLDFEGFGTKIIGIE